MTVDASTPNGQRPPAPLPQTRPVTPLDAAAAAASAVTGAIRTAAQTTGASFEYLLATAKVESDLNPNLSMRSSSATGLFQFIEQTWLEVVKQAGNTLGFGKYSDAITETKSGRYVVSDPAMRSEIMKLRKDPTANATMGGAFTRQNAAVLAKRIGREPTEGELYIAHFFGPYSASKMIRAAGSNPTSNAAQMFPAAARANRPIFYDRQGNARSVSGVYNELVRRYQVARASPTPGLTPMLAASEGAPAAIAASAAPPLPLPRPRAVAAAGKPAVAGPMDLAQIASNAGVTLAHGKASAASVAPPLPIARPRAVLPAGRPAVAGPMDLAQIASNAGVTLAHGKASAASVAPPLPIARPRAVLPAGRPAVAPPMDLAQVASNARVPLAHVTASAAAVAPPPPIARPRAVAAAVKPAVAAPMDLSPVTATAGVTLAYATANAPPAPQPKALAPARAEAPASVFHSMFSTEERRGAVSPLVAELWGGGPAPAEREPVAAVPGTDAAGPNVGAPRALDLFRDMPPNVRALFDGRA